LYFFKFVISN